MPASSSLSQLVHLLWGLLTPVGAHAHSEPSAWQPGDILPSGLCRSLRLWGRGCQLGMQPYGEHPQGERRGEGGKVPHLARRWLEP